MFSTSAVSAFRLTLAADSEGAMEDALAFPPPFVAAAGEHLILPVNEGISYPVDDPTMTMER